ncbi:hypothetical protein [Niveispirillum cyanobacteriorum]|uniref:Uncharacterized protein n=1 Tax=Niveispirillum cyanobacteriorum TaxID=1612173 RepID=A0A2K9NKK0_9PROT|nr:hypothetical protein [Niveispirillum cyanobacteriorum]AUN33599.1 hypothetical protein C0V82_25000 [Niveispirillum cyanobacteriorum]GGE47127.1 hypothetical protein GCM10011317_01860 [Niveispirillum cyanobacteriorum]
MSSTDVVNHVLTIPVACEMQGTGGGVPQPTLVYEKNVSANDVIMAGANITKIVFTKDPTTQIDFIFTGVNVTPAVEGTKILKDLKIVSVSDNEVTISDGQQNQDKQAVGNITLFFLVEDPETQASLISAGSKVVYSSDPEVVNDGSIV